jgi:hypothetical protein
MSSSLVVMPNDVINECKLPLPFADLFSTLDDAVKQFKAYAKEAGFAVVAVDVNA